MTLIKLQSSDGEIFSVDLNVVKVSITLKTLIENLGIDNEEIIPIQVVKGEILKKVIEWATHYKDDPSPIDDEKTHDMHKLYISSWDVDFLNVDKDTILKIILAANYLDIKGLLQVACKTVADLMKGKTPEEVRRIFNLKNDFTPEEEEKLRRENGLCEEK